MRGRTLLIALALVACAATAYAAPLAVDGFDACDLANEATVTGSGWSAVSASSPNRCKAQLVQPSGSASYLTQTYSATQTPQAYTKVTWSSGSGTRTLLGVGTASVNGCLVQLDSGTGELVLRYGTYSEIGRAAIPASTETGVGLVQSDGSGGSCSSSCVVTCQLFVDGVKKLGDSYSSIAGADYTVPTTTWIGSRTTNAGTYTATFDPLITEDQVSTIIGAARVLPLTPNAEPGLTQWNSSSSCSGSRWACVDDFASGSGAHDDTATVIRTSANGDLHAFGLTNVTLAAGESVAAVLSLGVARAVTFGDGRNWRLNQYDGTTSQAGATHVPPATFGVGSRLLRTVDPSGAAWTQSTVNSLQLRAEHLSTTGNIDVTALLAYADLRSPAPPERQNLQDWNGDGGLSADCLGDSTTLGTGFGTCELNPSAGYAPSDLPGGTDLPGQCTQSSHCYTCSNAITTPCNSNADCSGGGVCTYYGPCTSTGRWCTAAAAALTQTVGTRGTTWLNAGIGGNTLGALDVRIGTLLSGANLPSLRYCMVNGNVACTPDNTTGNNLCVGGSNAGATCASGNDSVCPGGICVKPCGTAATCQSVDCGTSKTAYCAKAANLASGTLVCSGDHTIACSANGDCTGHGTCVDYPSPDLVYVAIGGNDLRLFPTDAQCNLGSFPSVPPCPPQATVAAGQPTPAVTPTPGAKSCQRVSCSADSECSGATAGMCSDNLSKGCDSNADCGGTCLTAISRNGSGSVCAPGSCSTSTTKACSADSQCPRGETCNTGSRFCTCPCGAVPCATDSDCAMGGFEAFGGAASATWTPRCVAGKCKSCGIPFARFVCSGDHHTTCTKTADCAFVGGTCTEENPRYYEARRVVGAAEWLTRAKALKATIEAAGSKVIWLTYFPANQDPTLPDISGWYHARDELLATRNRILEGELGENVVDLYGLLNRVDQRTLRKRCVKNPSVTCASNSDCPSSSECADFNRSTLRAKDDPVHQNLLGASYTGSFVAAYTKQLSPVCSGDPTTGCGRCSISGASCLGADTCASFASGEKCLKTDSVCSAAGKGTCSRQRACWSTSNCTDHGLCTWDLTTKCQSDGDCTGKGVCRPEGTPAVGAG